jgi:hypothetical protein
LGKNTKMTLERKIYFKEKEKKMAVVVNVENYLKA